MLQQIHKDPIMARMTQAIESTGEYTLFLRDALFFLLRGRIHWTNTLRQMAFIGTDSLPIVLITGLAVGMVFCLQISGVMIKYGSSGVIGGVTAMSLARELTPSFTSVVVAGRVGAAIAAEIGSMKVTEQLDALTAMGVPPMYYLLLPRMLSAVVMMPLLTILALGIGLVGGTVVGVLAKGLILTTFIDSIKSLLYIEDVLKALLKSSFFGLLIATIACFQGIKTGQGAQGVGEATTKAVVYSLIAIFVSNYFLTFLLFTVLASA
ncbi:MAG: ABC transporter permease [Candidatus Sericytochromatia bacterium]|nr:ABC transporter permease [Candidatus Sericytochromatia bacterium]